MSKKDYKSEKKRSGAKAFAIGHVKFHDEENARELFGYGERYETPARTAVGGMGESDIPQMSSEDPTAEFVGPYEPDTQVLTPEQYVSDLEKMAVRGVTPGSRAGGALDAYGSAGEKTDPQGSWTGKPREKNGVPDGDEEPVQDADDL